MAGELVKARIKEVLDGIAQQCITIIHAVMDSDIGVNDKVNVNTLTGSNAYKDIEAINVDDMGIINILINEYAVLYVDGNDEEGRNWIWARRPANPSLPGNKSNQVPPPFEAIRDWAARKGVTTDNNVIEKIRWAIWWEGIFARPFINPSFEEIDRHFTDWADQLFEALCAELDEFFNQ